MKFKRIPEATSSMIDMTPMIDCVFQLLIFFLLTSPMITQAAIDPISPPSADQTTEMKKPDHEIVVTRENQIFLDAAVLSPAQMRERLLSGDFRGQRMTLSADALSPLGTSVEIMDACLQAGIALQVRTQGKK